MISTKRECYICGKEYSLQVHHCLHGSYRKLADKYGLTVYLCVWCHANLHDHNVHDAQLQELAQDFFEEQYGHDEFMRVFGKNFRR